VAGERGTDGDQVQVLRWQASSSEDPYCYLSRVAAGCALLSCAFPFESRRWLKSSVSDHC
jgi:hypothetical protein